MKEALSLVLLIILTPKNTNRKSLDRVDLRLTQILLIGDASLDDNTNHEGYKERISTKKESHFFFLSEISMYLS